MICCGECHNHPCPHEQDLRKLQDMADGKVTTFEMGWLKRAVGRVLKERSALIEQVNLLKIEIQQLKGN